MSEVISKEFYSNCFFEAIKRKLRHPVKTKLTIIRAKYNEAPVPHFLWSDGKADYDFGVERHLKPYEVLVFKGVIRRRNLGWNEEYKKIELKNTKKEIEHIRRKKMISNSGHDENKKYSGGKAGDQTKKEWAIIPWYSRPWTHILRHPDSKVRETIAKLAEAAAHNDFIGYDQNQRMTYWEELKKAGFNPSRIKVACESDCSAGVIANTKAAGYLHGIKELQSLSATYTGNMLPGFKKAGFNILREKKYLDSDNFLLRGDILLCVGRHTATNLTDGDKVSRYAIGWNKDEKGWWYADTGVSYLKNTWLQSNNMWYYFDKDGYMIRSAWKEWKGEYYYLSSDGSMATEAYIRSKDKRLYYWVDTSGKWTPKHDTANPDLKRYKQIV